MLHQRKFDILKEELTIERQPMPLPSYKPNAVIQPGLFKGTYGDYGLEILLLTHDDIENKAIITKISGDPNVPALQQNHYCRPQLFVVSD